MPTGLTLFRALALPAFALLGVFGARAPVECAASVRCVCAWMFIQPDEKRVLLQRASSDLVFRGTVVDTLRSEAGDGVARIAVVEWWHGARYLSPDTVVVRLYRADQRTNCEIVLQPGSEYLLFANRDSSGVAYTNMCAGTRGIPSAQLELRILGAGVTPQELRDR